MPDPWDDMVSTAEVHAHHDAALSMYGGSAGLLREGCVEGSLGASLQAVHYTADEPQADYLRFASCLAFYLAKNHCYQDGNKRTAWLAACAVLLRKGLTLRDDPAISDEATALMNGIAEGTVRSWAEVCRWFAPRLVAA